MIQGLERITRLDRSKDVYYLKEIIRGLQPKIERGTPASATALGIKDTILFDNSYIYICIATNTWKRVEIATW